MYSTAAVLNRLGTRDGFVEVGGGGGVGDRRRRSVAVGGGRRVWGPLFYDVLITQNLVAFCYYGFDPLAHSALPAPASRLITTILCLSL